METVWVGLTPIRVKKEGRMMVKIEFGYVPGDMYPFKATVKLGEGFGNAILGSSNASFDEAELDVIENVRKWKIGQEVKIPAPKEVEI
jgi:hypothetical protein